MRAGFGSEPFRKAETISSASPATKGIVPMSKAEIMAANDSEIAPQIKVSTFQCASLEALCGEFSPASDSIFLPTGWPCSTSTSNTCRDASNNGDTLLPHTATATLIDIASIRLV
jgi:hypothetical protein